MSLTSTRTFTSGITLIAACVTLSPAAGEEAKPPLPRPEFEASQIAFFETEIRPLLIENCLDCHSGVKAKTGLRLNSREGWLRGSDYRKVIDLQNPTESVLIHALRQNGIKDIPSMPKDGPKFGEEQIKLLTTWIGMGLPWPDEEVDVPDNPTQHWSFQPVTPPAIPAEAGHPIDYFIQRSQKESGVIPADRADRATLYRRVHFDLLGLPPQFEEQQKFVNDPAPDDEAWTSLVADLMDSPHYGERWARHWMDVARYSDTKGYEAGGRERRFVYSYTYRDWLIKAFNEDLPYDQFILYQLAAEQLVDWKGKDKHHLAALGFISLSKNGREELIVDDRVDTTFRGLMALTVACARCHDHKFDPVSTKEYYGLYGVFKNSLRKEQPTIGQPSEGAAYEKYLKELAEKQKVVDDFIEPKLAKVAEEFPDIANRRIQLLAKLDRVDRRELANKQRVIDRFIADSQMEPDKALIVTDANPPAQQKVFVRGNPARKGEVAPAQFLSIASPGEPKKFQQGSGRLEMAREIANRDNPLTARNIVNRVWMWHFGEGITRSIDDFGITGENPDHPELLDWLSHWFVENGWSIKKLHHLILTSETWQQQSGSKNYEENLVRDPENRLLWRFPKKRLELEQIRDSILAVSGTLNRKMYGRTVDILQPPYSDRRSVYAFIDRQNLPPVFRNFDFSNPQETTAKRPSTTIPMQALFTLNSEFIQNHSAILAEKAENREDGISYLHRQIFGRNPGENDRLLAESFLTAFESDTKGNSQQTNTEWSYGYGHINEANQVSFTPLPHWTGEAWQIGEERPVKNDRRGHLYADEGMLHPGNTSKESFIYQWKAPADLTVSVRGAATRPNVGKGNGVRIKIAHSKGRLLQDLLMEPARETMHVGIESIEVKEGDRLFLIVEPHEDHSSFDSVRWSPQIIDLSGRWPKWGLAEDFSGPATPATAWSAYAHALLNTNRFLFVE
ncbi:MAG: PSD1 and planctomycete cytochrome C domain-containing protein [Verrucomicrobiales bacterium]|nr:PSD1 and planctomycete cytochrome C domain-containing protein [Verrucomicrobiales bacterium]